MTSFITVTKFDTSSSKSKNNIGTHITVQNGTPNFISLSPFRYKDFSTYQKEQNKENNFSLDLKPKKKYQQSTKANDINDFSKQSQKIFFPLSINKENDIIDSDSLKNTIIPNLYENNQNQPQVNSLQIKKKKVKSSLKKELKMKINQLTAPISNRRHAQTAINKSRNPNLTESARTDEKHVVNTFKDISKSQEKVFENAQRIRYKKTIENFDRIENYKDKMIEFETEKITARFSPTRNTDFNSAQSANPILTSSQMSQKQIKYYFCPSHINNTSKMKGFNGS